MLPPQLVVFLVSVTPVFELRGGIPLGVAGFGLPVYQAFLFSVAGNLIPVLPLLVWLDPVSRWLSRKSALASSAFDWLFERTRRRHSETMEKYGAVGLCLFVAVPAPGTGAWTGCLLAFLFGMRLRYALPAVSAGVLGAGLLVAGATSGTVLLSRIMGPVGLLLALAALGLAYFLLVRRGRS